MPKQVPDKIKKLAGTFQPCRAKVEADIPVGALVCPRGVGKEVKKHFNRIAKVLTDSNLNHTADSDALLLLSEALATLDQARAKCREEGDVIVSTYGSVVNPWRRIVNSTMAQVHTYLQKFGMTPVARIGLATPKQQKELDKKSRFFGPRIAV